MRIQEYGDTNAALFKIVAANEVAGTVDPDAAYTLKAETTIAAGEEAEPQFLSNPWVEVAIFVKSAVAEAPAQLRITVGGK
jgi:hypothetical protein